MNFSFLTFCKYLSSLPNDEKGKVFEYYCKWFLLNDLRYSKQLKNVWLWDEWPDKWGKDKGIDLIAQTHSGKLWAIQAKAYSEDYYIKKEEIDSFLSESSRKQISFRLLISTSNKIGPNTREVLPSQEKEVSLCLRDKLESSDLEWPDNVSKLFPAKKKEPKKTRPHQKEALEKIMKGFDSSPIGQVHMACGTGKTLLGLWLSQKMEAKKILVLVPSISLVAQLYIEWSTNSDSFDFNPVFVCSDETVGKKSDEVIADVSELGFPVTTSFQELADHLADDSRIQIVFSTYHSSPVIAQACSLKSSHTFDLVIADEAHRISGSLKSDFATIVNSRSIKAKYKLYMTATPKIFSEHVKKKTEELEYEIASMDDEEKFGPVFYKLSFSEAIRKDLLSDYQVFISIMDQDTYRDYAEKGRFVTYKDHETDARTLASQILIIKAIDKLKLKRIITFHNKKESAKEFISSLPQVLALHSNNTDLIGYTGSIFGEMRQSDRKHVLKKFEHESKDGASILANVKCLSEGVDVPSLDAIAFIDPKGSEIDIVQAVGRVIRKSSDKKIGTIIIPLFIDKKIDENVALDDSCFKIIGKVIRSLRAHDDTLAEELDNIRLELGKRSFKKSPKLKKIVIDVPEKISSYFANSLELKIVQQSSASWFFYFGLLEKYIQENGGRWPQAKEKFEGYKIGMWCSGQRQAYKGKRNHLENWQVKKLESIGFEWDELEERWGEKYLELKEYRKNNPIKWPSGEIFKEKALARWCVKQRGLYTKGKLSEIRIKKLKEIGFDFNPLDSRWKLQYEKLIKYQEVHPGNWPSELEDLTLSKWCAKQRVLFKKNKLSSDKIKLLSVINFDWNPEDTSWKKQLNYLLSFRKLNRARWPYQAEEFPVGNYLGAWCSTQRQKYKNNKLAQDKVADLDSIGFIWDLEKSKFLQQLALLQEFKEKHERLPIKNKEESREENQLGHLCASLRSSYRKGTLPDWKKELLNDVQFTWIPDKANHEKSFNERLAFLKKYRISNPNSWPSASDEYPSGNKIGRWCIKKRSLYKNKKLPQYQADALNSIGFPWNL